MHEEKVQDTLSMFALQYTGGAVQISFYETPKTFQEKEDAISIRINEEFCKDESFFSSSYLVKYSGIPTRCIKCQKDLVHHKGSWSSTKIRRRLLLKL